MPTDVARPSVWVSDPPVLEVLPVARDEFQVLIAARTGEALQIFPTSTPLIQGRGVSVPWAACSETVEPTT